MKQLSEIRKVFQSSKRILVFSGSGISAESGIPTFRSKGGWWRNINPLTLATFEAFQQDPQKVWEWYESRRQNIALALPNAAHFALAEWERAGKEVVIITQNVDDLHERAGSSKILHVHGSIWRVRCLAENKVKEDRNVPLAELPPVCQCGSLLRPDVVWFGESLPEDVCQEIESILESQKIDLVLVIGTEATFGYIQEWVLRSRLQGALIVEINPNQTELSSLVDARIEKRAGEALLQLH